MMVSEREEILRRAPTRLIPIEKVMRNPNQPRTEFEQAALQELADSIVRHGLVQAIIVRDVGTGEFVILGGERRWRAHKLLNRTEIKATIIVCDDEMAYEISIIENCIRRDVNLLEEARGYKYLKDKHEYTLAELAKVVGKNPTRISNALLAMEEEPEVQDYIKRGLLSAAMLPAIRNLPNIREKLELLKKVENEEIKKTEVHDYAARIRESYRIAAVLGIDPEEVRAKGLKHKGLGGRFDISEDEIIPDDFQFFFICDHMINEGDIDYFPRVRILMSAFSHMVNKGSGKQLAKILSRRKDIECFFMDSGAVPAAKKRQWDFYDKTDELIQFYENIKPDVCVTLDVPAYTPVLQDWGLTVDQVIERTLQNAIPFRDWEPSFPTTKVYALQGLEPEEFLKCFRGYCELGVFEKNEKRALAFGGIARSSFKEIQRKLSLVLADPEYKRLRPTFEFVHGFGVGQPERVVELYYLGVNSCDALTTMIITAVGSWWVRGKIYSHLIHESAIARRVRLHFNIASFWGQVCEKFAEVRGLPLSKAIPTLDVLDEYDDDQEADIEDVTGYDNAIGCNGKTRIRKRGRIATKKQIDWDSMKEVMNDV